VYGGLGLSLVATMAERLGGSVTVADRPGGGASVTVELPLEPVAAPAERSELRPVAEGRTGLRILVVENNAAMRIAIGSMLDKLGHGYRMVGRGPAAVDHVGRGEADLVLVAAASTVAGVETIRSVRGLAGPSAAVPIFAIVAPGDEGGRTALLETGADAVLTKPVSMRDLGDAIVAAAQRLGDRAAAPSRAS
jgi:CheY-like chemotaxis protein